MADEVLLSSRSADGVLTLTMNRPAQRNALNGELTRALRDALVAANADDEVRCVVLAGAGPAFSAGGDLKEMVERVGDRARVLDRHRQELAPLARALLLLERPTVARVHGDALGAGLSLAVACDYAYAATTARLGATFARAALAPDLGATWLLVKVLGLRAARELALAAEPATAEEAARLGLVTAAVAPDALDATVAATAARLARGPTRALGLARRALAEGAGSTLADALEREGEVAALLASEPEHAEAVRTFVDRPRKS